jgi:hypothetical protein
MGLMIDFWVTNGYDEPVRICRGEIRYWKGFRRRTFTRLQLERDMPPKTPAVFRAIFPLTPVPVPDKKPFKAKLFFIDNYNRRHRAGKFTFKTHDPNQPYPPD